MCVGVGIACEGDLVQRVHDGGCILLEGDARFDQIGQIAEIATFGGLYRCLHERANLGCVPIHRRLRIGMMDGFVRDVLQARKCPILQGQIAIIGQITTQRLVLR